MWIKPYLFIHLSAERRLSCFHFMAIINKAAMDIHYKLFCVHMLSFLLGIHLGVELLGHVVTLCLKFWGTAGLFSKAATSAVPLAVFERSNFSTSCQHLLLSGFLITAMLVSVKYYLIVVLACISLMVHEVEHLPVLTGHLCIFRKMSSQMLYPFFNYVVFLLLSCKSTLHILDSSPLSTPILWVVFSLFWWHHLQQKSF